MPKVPPHPNTCLELGPTQSIAPQNPTIELNQSRVHPRQAGAALCWCLGGIDLLPRLFSRQGAIEAPTAIHVLPSRASLLGLHAPHVGFVILHMLALCPTNKQLLLGPVIFGERLRALMHKPCVLELRARQLGDLP